MIIAEQHKSEPEKPESPRQNKKDRQPEGSGEATSTMPGAGKEKGESAEGEAERDGKSE